MQAALSTPLPAPACLLLSPCTMPAAPRTSQHPLHLSTAPCRVPSPPHHAPVLPQGHHSWQGWIRGARESSAGPARPLGRRPAQRSSRAVGNCTVTLRALSSGSALKRKAQVLAALLDFAGAGLPWRLILLRSICKRVKLNTGVMAVVNPDRWEHWQQRQCNVAVMSCFSCPPPLKAKAAWPAGTSLPSAAAGLSC